MDTETFSPEEVAEKLGVHPTLVRKQARVGAWPYHRIGRKIRFTSKQVQLILNLTERRPTAAPSQERLVAVGLNPQAAPSRQRRRVASSSGSSPGA